VDAIKLGEDFEVRLAGAVAGARVFLAIIGPHWRTATNEAGNPRLHEPADFVRREIEAALQNGLAIIPIIVAGATMPRETDLPESLKAFAKRQALVVRNDPDFQRDVSLLVTRLCEFGLHRVADTRTVDGEIIGDVPPPPKDFVDREDHLEGLLAAVRTGHKSIVNIRGSAGMGKTAFARKVAAAIVDDYPLQLTYPMRGSQSDPARPEEALAEWVNRLAPGRPIPVGRSALQGAFLSLLRGKRAIVFLDDVADKETAEDLLPPAPCVLMLTSRRSFMLAGQYPVDLGRLPTSAAVQLLCDICERVEGSAELLAGLCGGLPFALRLAAGMFAQGPFVTVRDFIDYLQSDRLRHLEGAELVMTASVSRLTDDLRTRLALLTVFVGDATMEGVRAVWGDTMPIARAHLTRLMEFCLLQWTPTTERFAMHDLLREYMRGQLNPQMGVAARFRHAQFVTDVLRDCEKEFLAGAISMSQALSRLDVLWPEVKAAFLFLRENGDKSKEARPICSALVKSAFLFLEVRESIETQLNWAEGGLQAAEQATLETDVHVHLRRVAWFIRLRDPLKAKELLERALAICTRLDLAADRGKILGYLALIAQQQGHLDEATRLIEDSIHIAKQTGERRAQAIALGRKADIEKMRGKADVCVALLSEAVSLDGGDERGEALDLQNLAAAHALRGSHADVLDCTARAAALWGRLRRYGDEWRLTVHAVALCRQQQSSAMADSLRARMTQLLRQDEAGYEVSPQAMAAGLAAYNAGDSDLAVACFQAALQWAQDCHDRRQEGNALGNLGCACSQRGEYDKAIQWHERALVIDRELKDAAGEAMGSWDMGETYEQMGRLADAARLMQVRIDYERSQGNPDTSEMERRVLSMTGSGVTH